MTIKMIEARLLMRISMLYFLIKSNSLGDILTQSVLFQFC